MRGEIFYGREMPCLQSNLLIGEVDLDFDRLMLNDPTHGRIPDQTIAAIDILNLIQSVENRSWQHVRYAAPPELASDSIARLSLTMLTNSETSLLSQKVRVP